MEPTQIKLLQQTFKKIEPVATETGELFYARLFEMDPSMRQLFKGDLKTQARMVMTAIGLTIKGLDQPEAVKVTLQEIGQRHIGYGAIPNDFDMFGAALMWAFRQSVPDEWTDDVETAWVQAFEFIRQNMKLATRPNGDAENAMSVSG